MELTKDGNMLNVKLTVDQLYKLYMKHYLRYEYFCPMVHVAAKMKSRKKSFDDINDILGNKFGDGAFECDAVVSANTCLQLVTAAGLSKKGQAKYRQSLRDMGFTVTGNNVVSSAYERHATVRPDQPNFENRMIEIGGEVLTKINESYVLDLEYDTDVEYRIGLLKTVTEKNPNLVCNFRFPL